MILSHNEISKLIKSKKIIVKPLIKKSDIRPTGIRIHLNSEILIPVKGQKISFANPKPLKYIKFNLKEKSYIIKPNEFILASSHEYIKTPKNIIGFLDGRSTLARLGLTTHITASTIDGMIFGQNIVLEIKNEGVFEIELNHHDPVGLLSFIKLSSAIKMPQDKKYLNQNGVKSANLVKV